MSNNRLVGSTFLLIVLVVFTLSVSSCSKADEINVASTRPMDLYDRGVGLLKKGEYKQAKTIFDQVLERDKEFSRAYESRGKAYMGLKEYDAAIKDFDRFLNSNTSFFSFKADSPILRYKAQCYLEQGRQKEAIDTLDKALRQVPSDKEALRLRIKAHELAGESEEAKEDQKMLKGIRVDRSTEAEEGGFGAILTLSSDVGPEGCLKRKLQLDQLIVKSPNDYVALCQRAKLNAALGKPEEAVRDYSMVLSLVTKERDRISKLVKHRRK